MSSKGLKKEVPEYERFEYDRAYVTKSEVIDLVNEVLDLKQSDMSRFVVDGKITPVIVLNNQTNYVRWDFLVYYVIRDGLFGDYVYLDNNGNFYVCDNFLAGVGLSIVDKNQDEYSFPYYNYFINVEGIGSGKNVYSRQSDYFLMFDKTFAKKFYVMRGVEVVFTGDLLDVDVGAGDIVYGLISDNGKYIVVVDTNKWAYLYEGVRS